jgi:hypothetical protein
VKPEKSNFAHPSPAKRWLVLLCLLLIATMTAAQTLHRHADDPAPNGKHCPICQVAHSAVQIVPTAQLHVALQAANYLFFPASIDRKSSLDSAPLFSRPPPPLV